MDELIYSGDNSKILKRAGRYYLQYDGGEVVQKIYEVEITEAEAKRAMTSENEAYAIVAQTFKEGRMQRFVPPT
jgi:hypothetical protein